MTGHFTTTVDLLRHAGRDVLVVGHAGIIRLIVSEVLGAPLDRLFRITEENSK